MNSIQFFDLSQQKRLFAHTIIKNPWWVQKIALPLHRQKEQNPGDKDNNTFILR
jgi:hypothetical protein